MRQFKQIIYTSLLIGVTLISAGCSDEFSDPTEPKNPQEIRFAVRLDRDADTPSGIRPAESQSKLRRITQNNKSRGAIEMSGCSEKLYLVPLVKDEIVSTVRAENIRSISYDSSTIDNFGVYASTSDSREDNPIFSSDYMVNEQVTRQSGWRPSKQYYWPGKGTLHLNAYSPFRSAGGEEGITKLPQPGSENPEIEFKVAEEVEHQEDLLYSVPKDANESPCNLTFNHALSAIEFAAGSEMAPITVSTIEISGVADSGILNIESGAWRSISGNQTYTIDPACTLQAEEGSEYVVPGTIINTKEQQMLLIPQILGESAVLKLTGTYKGKPIELTASLEGQVWRPGTTITYRVSANPASDQLQFDVTGEFNSAYTGQQLPFHVSSYYETDGEKTPVDWKAEFIDDNGNVIDKPDWVSSISTSGSGEGDYMATTIMREPIFLSTSPQTNKLRQSADINTSTGIATYNLSSSSGNGNIENTANTYVINSPGRYRLPLVYGNAIKNGATNTASYTTSTHNSTALKVFVNHLGNAITNPYIYNNEGCVPSEAALIWEDELNVVRNVTLSEDGEWIEFEIPKTSIRQTNALVGVRDLNGNILWSWQLWITDYELESGSVTFGDLTGENSIMTRNIGYRTGGDKVEFPASEVKVRFTQTGLPEDIVPHTVIITISQEGITTTSSECNTNYQWGRKDPMMSSIDHYYSADHKLIETHPTENYNTLGLTNGALIAYFIEHPDKMLLSDHSQKFPYSNLWNITLSNSAASIHKSVYDPCPVGFRMPGLPVVTYIVQNGHASKTEIGGTSGYDVTVAGETLYFPALGYRSGETGIQTEVGSQAHLWTNHTGRNVEGSSLIIVGDNSDTPKIQIVSDPLGHCFGVRGVNE